MHLPAIFPGRETVGAVVVALCTSRLKITSDLHDYSQSQITFAPSAGVDRPFWSDITHRPILPSSSLGAARRTGPIVARPCRAIVDPISCHSESAVNEKIG